MKERSAQLTLLPQVAELVAGGKIRLSDTVGALLDEDDINASKSVETLLKGYREDVNAYYLQLLLNKYRRYVSIEDAATRMFEAIGMNATSFAGPKPSRVGYNVPEVITTGYDFNKFHFTLSNGGKYAGKQIISAKAAEIVLKFR